MIVLEWKLNVQKVFPNSQSFYIFVFQCLKKRWDRIRQKLWGPNFSDSKYLGVSKNSGTPISSILIGFSIMNHPFWGTTIFGNIQVFQDWFDWFLRPSTTFATGAASSMSTAVGGTQLYGTTSKAVGRCWNKACFSLLKVEACDFLSDSFLELVCFFAWFSSSCQWSWRLMW